MPHVTQNHEQIITSTATHTVVLQSEKSDSVFVVLWWWGYMHAYQTKPGPLWSGGYTLSLSFACPSPLWTVLSSDRSDQLGVYVNSKYREYGNVVNMLLYWNQ